MFDSNSWIIHLVILSMYHLTTSPVLALKAQKQGKVNLALLTKRFRHHHFRLTLLRSEIAGHYIAQDRNHQAYNFTLSSNWSGQRVEFLSREVIHS